MVRLSLIERERRGAVDLLSQISTKARLAEQNDKIIATYNRSLYQNLIKNRIRTPRSVKKKKKKRKEEYVRRTVRETMPRCIYTYRI